MRLSMDKASFPVATKDMANITGMDVGLPYRPSLPTRGDVLEYMAEEIRKSRLQP